MEIEMGGRMSATSYTSSADLVPGAAVKKKPLVRTVIVEDPDRRPDTIITVDAEVVDADGKTIELVGEEGKTVSRQRVALGGLHIDDEGAVWLENVGRDEFIFARDSTPPKEVVLSIEGEEWARVPLIPRDDGPRIWPKDDALLIRPAVIKVCVADKDTNQEEYARWKRLFPEVFRRTGI